MRKHYEEAERQSPGASRGALINPTKVPEPVQYVWHWFLELSYSGRTYTSGGSPMPLSNAELWSWCQLQQVQFKPWELRTIRLLDAAWIEIRNRSNG